VKRIDRALFHGLFPQRNPLDTSDAVVTLPSVPRELTPIRTHYTSVADRMRVRREMFNGHYTQEKVRERIVAATCDESGLTEAQLAGHIEAVISTVLRKVAR
jgi:hypothetical protein